MTFHCLFHKLHCLQRPKCISRLKLQYISFLDRNPTPSSDSLTLSMQCHGRLLRPNIYSPDHRLIVECIFTKFHLQQTEHGV